MAIGYYNFGTLQQGNQQIVNSLAGLGQQIGHAIETHAATQSAQAMLPIIQQQYATGIDKLSRGEQGGMADVIQAANLAGQNPYTAGIGHNMISGMQQVSHMARTQAFLQGRGLATMAAHPEMYNPDGTINTSRLGQPATPKAKAQDPIKQQKDLAGLQKTYMEQMGTAQDQNNVHGYNSAAQNMSALNQKMAQLTGATTAMPLNFHAKQKALELIKQAQEDPSKAQENQLAIRMMGNDPANLALTPEQRDVLAKVQKSYQANPNLPAHQKVLQQLGIPPTLLQPSKNQQSQPSAQPATGMIPAASGNMYAENEGNTPETADEQEAVGGGEEEQQSSEQVA